MAKKAKATEEVKAPSEVTLIWDNPVDLTTGLQPSAYGIMLYKVDEVYCGNMSPERAEVELGRTNGLAFTEE